jgi:hypothetical protein
MFESVISSSVTVFGPTQGTGSNGALFRYRNSAPYSEFVNIQRGVGNPASGAGLNDMDSEYSDRFPKDQQIARASGKGIPVSRSL